MTESALFLLLLSTRVLLQGNPKFCPPFSAEIGTTLEKSIGGPYVISNYRNGEPKNLNLKPYFWVRTAFLQGRDKRSFGIMMIFIILMHQP